MQNFKIAQIRQRVRALVKRAQATEDQGDTGAVLGSNYGKLQKYLDPITTGLGWGAVGTGAGYLGNELIHRPQPNPPLHYGPLAGARPSPAIRTRPENALETVQRVLANPNTPADRRMLAEAYAAAAQAWREDALHGNSSTLEGLPHDTRALASRLVNVDDALAGDVHPARQDFARLVQGGDTAIRPNTARDFLDEAVDITDPATLRTYRTIRETAPELIEAARRQRDWITVDHGLTAAPRKRSWIRRWLNEAFSPHDLNVRRVAGPDGRVETVVTPGVRQTLRRRLPWVAGGAAALWGLGKLTGANPALPDSVGDTTWADDPDFMPDPQTAPSVTNTPPAVATAPIPPPPPTAPQKSPIPGGHGR